MFSHHNIGGKIETLANVLMWIGIILSILCGVAIAMRGAAVLGNGVEVPDGAAGIVLGILVAVVGSVSSWISSFLLYGYGHMIKTLDEIRRNR